MKLQSVHLQNFRSFGPTLTTVSLDSLTALIGVNGSGKTALLCALSRLFGVFPGQKGLKRADFHVPPGKGTPTSPISLSIEVRIVFPELSAQKKQSDAVAPCFKQMLIDNTGTDPFCRIRLEATWTPTNTTEGEIEERMFWITTPNQKVEDSDKVPFKPHERSLIHVLYVPASRDPSREVRAVASSLLGRLLRAIEWSDKNKKDVPDLSIKIENALHGEVGVKTIQGEITKSWKDVHDDEFYAEPRLQFGTKTFEEVLTKLNISFGPSFDDAEHLIDRLSEGQQSLFHFALAVAVFKVERQAAEAGKNAKNFGLSLETLAPPALTVLAVEEPENHLAPQFLGRIMQLLQTVADSDGGQVVLSSHAVGIMSRVDATGVRYFRLSDDPGKAERKTMVTSLTLPKATDEAHKFVKEAVKAYPELYFARIVVLCEGDSEEIILPRVLKAHDLSLDGKLISVVPLGGRHVNHFWRLLTELQIPHVTLLDLDRERNGGGATRIASVCKELLKIGTPRSPLLDTTEGTLTDEDLETLNIDFDQLPAWLDELEKHGVYFSQPLDLDLMMLEAFPDRYKSLAPPNGGPRIPKVTDAKYADRIKSAIRVVLGDEGGDGSSYSSASQGLFPWYSYLFLGRGKPSTHVLALVAVPDSDLKSKMPAPLKKLAEKVSKQLTKQ